MQVTMFMAMSVNGIIADNDGKEDFLSHDNWDVFVELAEKTGVFIIGRKTYEVVLRNYEGFGYNDVKADRIIVTTDTSFIAPQGYRVANSPREAVELAKHLGHEGAILTGGAELNSSFVADGLINKVIINIEPAFVGNGTPLFAHRDFACRLHLQDVKRCGSGILQLHYAIGDELA